MSLPVWAWVILAVALLLALAEVAPLARRYTHRGQHRREDRP